MQRFMLLEGRPRIRCAFSIHLPLCIFSSTSLAYQDAQRPAQVNLVCLKGSLDQEGHSAACIPEQMELFVFGYVLCFFPLQFVKISVFLFQVAALKRRRDSKRECLCC